MLGEQCYFKILIFQGSTGYRGSPGHPGEEGGIVSKHLSSCYDDVSWCLNLYPSMLTQNVVGEQVNRQICFSVSLHLTIDSYAAKKATHQKGVIQLKKPTHLQVQTIELQIGNAV